MTTEEAVKLFFEFLDLNNCKEEYEKSFGPMLIHYPTSPTMEEFFKETSPRYYIYNAFEWEKTSLKSLPFWRGLDVQWGKFLANVKFREEVRSKRQKPKPSLPKEEVEITLKLTLNRKNEKDLELLNQLLTRI